MPLSKYDIEVDLDNRQGTSHAYLVELVGANKRVLDVGCDTGYLGEALAAYGNRVAGFEMNEAAAAEARTKLERVEVGDLENVDLVELFGPGSFDVVVFGDVLEHLRAPLPALRQARPLLAPGGSVLISTPNVAHGDVRLALLSGRFRYTKLGILDETHTRFFTRDSLVEFLHDAGFVLAELRRTRAELFTTEVGVVEHDYDPALLERLRRDDEATTYQFVARAVPDDATTLQSEQALELDRVRGQLRAEEERSLRLQAALDEATARADELAEVVRIRETRLAEVQAAHDDALGQRDAADAERRELVAARDAAVAARDKALADLAELQAARVSLVRRVARRVAR